MSNLPKRSRCSVLSYMWVDGGLLQCVVRVLDGGTVNVANGSSVVDDVGVVTVAVSATVAKDDGHDGEGDQERALLQ